jgi:hypothetical protein
VTGFTGKQLSVPAAARGRDVGAMTMKLFDHKRRAERASEALRKCRAPPLASYAVIHEG